MKATMFLRPPAWLVSTAIFLVQSANAEPTSPAPPRATVAPTPAAPQIPPRAVFRIESIQPVHGEEPGKDVTWLGVYTEEASEALGSQLGLAAGEGLLITYVAAGSPAAKAGLQKNDVLAQMGDQLLVHPAQLAKLIRSHKDGDPVSLTLYRRGQKQVLTATLGKRIEQLGVNWGTGSANSELKLELDSAINNGIHEQLETLHETLMRANGDKQRIKIDVERSMEEARKALQEALRNKSQSSGTAGLDVKELEALANGAVGIGEDATIIVKKDGKAVKTILQTDDSGCYVIVASPRKRLTAHDKDGKLLFDGEIESPEQQEKVPADVWEKVKPMIEQMGPVDAREAKPHAQSDGEPKS